MATTEEWPTDPAALSALDASSLNASALNASARETSFQNASEPVSAEPHYGAPPRERRYYAEAMVIYASLALAALFWGAFTVAAGAGIMRSVLAPVAGVPAGGPTPLWTAFAVLVALVLAGFAAVLGYGEFRSRQRSSVGLR